MIKFGMICYNWMSEWTVPNGLEAIKKTKEFGFDALEIALLDAPTFDAELTKKQLKEYDLEAYCSLVLPPYAHMTVEPKKALEFLRIALDKTETLGSPYLGGALYANAGTLTRNPPTADERKICQDVLGEFALDAQKRGITLCLEPANRYEVYLYTSADEALDLANAIGTDNTGILLDTYHMNIEEHGFLDPIIKCGKKLKYMHISESDRGMPGIGNVDWDQVFAGLAAIQYDGPLVVECFSTVLKALIGSTCMWRPSSDTPEELATGSLEFLKKYARKYSLIK